MNGHSFPSPDAAFSVDFIQSYQHVYIQDFETCDTPPPLQTGLEQYSAGESIILVTTRSDTEGNVRVEFFNGEFPSNLSSAIEVLYRGEISVPSGILGIATVGAEEEEDFFSLDYPGAWNIEVGVIGSPTPWYVAVCLRPTSS